MCVSVCECVRTVDCWIDWQQQQQQHRKRVGTGKKGPMSGVGKEIRWIRRVDDDLYLCIKQDNDHDEDGTMTCT